LLLFLLLVSPCLRTQFILSYAHNHRTCMRTCIDPMMDKSAVSSPHAVCFSTANIQYCYCSAFLPFMPCCFLQHLLSVTLPAYNCIDADNS
jgi:hypothetical protein